MKNRNFNIALTTLALGIGTLVFFYRKYKNSKKEPAKANELREEGNKLFKMKKYHDAIKIYQETLGHLESNNPERVSVLNNLALTSFILRNDEDSIKYSTAAFEIDQFNVKAIKRRFESYKRLKQRDEALEDIFLCGLLSKNKKEDAEKYKNVANEYLNEVVDEKIRKEWDPKKVFPSSVLFDEFFDTFPALFDQLREKYSEYDFTELEELMKNKRYEKIFQLDISVYNKFIIAGIFYIRKMNDKSINLLEKDDFIYSVLLKEYIKSFDKDYIIPPEFVELVKNYKNDVSVQYYAALIYSNIKDENNYKACIDIALNKPNNSFVYAHKLCAELKEPVSEDYIDLVTNTIKKYNDKMDILGISAELYIHLNQLDTALSIIELIKRYYPNDPRTLLFQSLGCEIKKDKKEAIKYLERAIEIDPKYFKPYLYIGNYLMMNNDSRCKEYYEKGFRYASNYEEAYSVMQPMVLMDVQSRILSKYPKLMSD
ncbi:Protein unc-45 like protein A [Astathelohania contejeani]|uniref:Protein unc-45 like protein A n=1 Tax=Astathelohania contejeani TaxID=164912 RepID=A0ABQ7I097_9MICR|nr:Protein unc-45 like protein A [Thelohania contejeani]